MAYDKRRIKKKIVEELEMIPVVLTICAKHGISRQTYYRWRDGDPIFKSDIEKALDLGRESINELAESKIIKKIDEEERWAIEYWSTHNNPRYMKKDNPLRTAVLGEQPPIALVQFAKPVKEWLENNTKDKDIGESPK